MHNNIFKQEREREKDLENCFLFLNRSSKFLFEIFVVKKFIYLKKLNSFLFINELKILLGILREVYKYVLFLHLRTRYVIINKTKQKIKE